MEVRETSGLQSPLIGNDHENNIGEILSGPGCCRKEIIDEAKKQL